MSTPHNKAEVGDFAETVLMPGDPLRAKWIAETFLSEVVEVNSVRNMLGYTGNYKGKRVSVMGSGMGMPSIGIYSYELFNVYNVKRIIRVGSAGSYKKEVKIRDVVIAMGSSTNSNYAQQYHLNGTYSALASYNLVEKAVEVAKRKKVNYHVGNVFSSDVFYTAGGDDINKWASMGVSCVEMESYALYCNAAYLGKEALTLLTISDSLITHEATTAEERQTSFAQMIEIALEIA
ncbi:MAG: purine-nucleoside phosphorylase [Bacillales bacterium]|jgi:purine-nucleoside phosphorylase|nr:purine-nucleoside phosphorylase [Bacillales bacterium]